MKSELKKKAVDYLGGCCLLCGFSYNQASLDFHHVNPSEKIRNISSFSSWSSQLEEELQKCALLCKNCHSTVHNEDFDPEIFVILEY